MLVELVLIIFIVYTPSDRKFLYSVFVNEIPSKTKQPLLSNTSVLITLSWADSTDDATEVGWDSGFIKR